MAVTGLPPVPPGLDPALARLLRNIVDTVRRQGADSVGRAEYEETVRGLQKRTDGLPATPADLELLRGRDGMDGAGVEYCFTAAADENVPMAEWPRNAWGYDDLRKGPLAVGSRLYYDGVAPTDADTPYLLRFSRLVPGIPNVGAKILDDWRFDGSNLQHATGGDGIVVDGLPGIPGVGERLPYTTPTVRPSAPGQFGYFGSDGMHLGVDWERIAADTTELRAYYEDADGTDRSAYLAQIEVGDIHVLDDDAQEQWTARRVTAAPRFTHRASGALPAGLSVDVSGTVPRLAGQTTESGRWDFVVETFDRNVLVQTENYQITIA